MSQLRFAVVGNLTWRLDLEDVALDAPNAQSATAQFQGMSVGGAAMQVAKVFKRSRCEVVLASWLGDDIFGRMIENQLDEAGLDTELVSIIPRQATLIECGLSLTKAGNLTIQTTPDRIPNHILANLTSEVAWVYLTSDSGSLEQINELLHQASLKGIKVAWQLPHLQPKDYERVRYLLEDVTLAIVSSKAARELTGAGQNISALKRLATFVENVLLIGDTTALATGGQAISEATWKTKNSQKQTQFAAGFTVALARKGDLSFALANAAKTIDIAEAELILKEKNS